MDNFRRDESGSVPRGGASEINQADIGGSGSRRVTPGTANSSNEFPPYNPEKAIFDFEADGTTEYVRVYTAGTTQPGGQWMMRAEDIDGLSAEQIQQRFDLPNVPTHITDVLPPEGTTIRTGTVNAGNFGGTGGGVQFQLLERIPNSAFSNQRPLP